MHYYKRNLGDYAKKAGRLSMLQHGSYTLLIDACYDRERFPTLDEAIEWTWASSTEEIEAVEFVLKRFFTLMDGRYVQDRIQEEITEYHAKSEKNRQIATDREEKRKASSTNRERNVHESPPNQEPRTKNQEPSTPKPPSGVGVRFAEFWEAYPRKVGKDAAWKAFAKRKPDSAMLAQMLSAIATQRRSEQWLRDGGQFIPHPSTWLNEGRWQDEGLSLESEQPSIFARQS